MNTGGKKVYGYLKADVKAIVNSIVNELAKEEKVSECYQKWLESKSEILHFYKDADAKQLPLSEQKELKSIKKWSSGKQSDTERDIYIQRMKDWKIWKTKERKRWSR